MTVGFLGRVVSICIWRAMCFAPWNWVSPWWWQQIRGFPPGSMTAGGYWSKDRGAQQGISRSVSNGARGGLAAIESWGIGRGLFVRAGPWWLWSRLGGNADEADWVGFSPACVPVAVLVLVAVLTRVPRSEFWGRNIGAGNDNRPTGIPGGLSR